MNKEQEKGLFNQIEEVLQAHEDTYEPGAWEDFDASRKKSKRKWPIYVWIAAASILLVASIGLYEMGRKDQLMGSPVLVKGPTDQLSPELDKTIEIPISQSPIQAAAQTVQRAKPQVVVSSNKDLPTESVVAVPVFSEQVASIATSTPPAEALQTAPLYTEIERVTAKIKSAPVLAGAYDSLVNQSRATVPIEKSANKLTYSLVVSPSLGNQKVNFGAGMELSYPLTNNLSINSGLMYSAFNAKSESKSQARNSVSQAESANLAMAGIELPLGIQYQHKDGFYAAAGISAVGFINDKLEYNYLEDKTIMQSAVVGGNTHEFFTVVSEKKTAKSIEPLTNYMGFFNFSAGKKQAFGKVNLNIGPFVKLPFSSVSSERIKLVQGGLKLSVDF
ncbi:MAG: outer membrane beta-barrel protein [Bacteroidia bacterium]